MEIKLPVSANPSVRGYLHHAFQMAVLDTCPKATPWRHMNFIQLVSNGETAYPVTFYMPDQFGYNWSMLAPFFEYQVINRSFIQDNGMDFKKLVVDSLAKGYYVYTYINEVYVPHTIARNRNINFNHMILLHGYNHDTREVYFLGYADNGEFNERTMAIDELEKAYYDNNYQYPRYEDCFYMYRISDNRDTDIAFDVSVIVHQLENFLYSRKEGNNVFDIRAHESNKLVYGFDVYDACLSALAQMAAGNIYVNVVPIHILMEHKRLMVERLEYMEGMFPQSLQRYAQSYVKLSRGYESLRNLVLKCRISNNRKMLEQAMDKLRELAQEERTIMESLLESLQAKVS
ncbi:hypothetical protein B5M42_011355 [Paenibacillus athensensis]|uniref:Butirosin biosynthesis protein H N-terminal domain-containing protein n=1 Tax=Paenibacillus athensensis TaxID=1967502 RepID=A0A4Y8PWG0_9BACL|nr:hypothetical protein [Paenibacillus athensensis]MCD1259431.1 hypothetical protein [Paenibacillus athensensis]